MIVPLLAGCAKTMVVNLLIGVPNMFQGDTLASGGTTYIIVEVMPDNAGTNRLKV